MLAQFVGPNRLMLLVHSLEVATMAGAAYLGAAKGYAMRRMKAYKVTLPPEKAAALDVVLRYHGITLGALTEAFIDNITERFEEGRDLTEIALMCEHAVEIKARRKARGYKD